MKNRLVTVFGGSGFVGRYIVQRLAAAGARVRVAVRDTEEADFLKTCGDLGQISFIPASITSDTEVNRAVVGADFVVNCVGILFERGARSFTAIHVDGAARVAKAAKAAGAQRFVQLSALGADAESKSAYARSKAAGEQAVLAAFPEATLLRPSVIFGPEDGFFNMFAELARMSPVLPYFTSIVPHAEGGGGTKFQPVYVGDVAAAAVSALTENGYQSKTYELVGPTVYTMREILEMICRYTDRSTWIVGLPFWVARIQAVFLQLLPTPLLTPDQVKLLRVDNIADGSKPGLEAFGITPETAESIVPTYLRRFRPYQQLKKIRFNAR
ncbi:MAG: complex I NDUFA9 subunit family protein [Rhodospirillaceae bacterium]